MSDSTYTTTTPDRDWSAYDASFDRYTEERYARYEDEERAKAGRAQAQRLAALATMHDPIGAMLHR